MKFKYTILYVENVEKTLKFYENAFACKKLFIHDKGDYGELATGDTRLAFSSLELMRSLGKQPAKVADQAPVFEIAFETDDVQIALSTALKYGAVLVQEATLMPWGQTISYVKDMNGFLIEICSPVN